MLHTQGPGRPPRTWHTVRATAVQAQQLHSRYPRPPPPGTGVQSGARSLNRWLESSAGWTSELLDYVPQRAQNLTADGSGGGPLVLPDAPTPTMRASAFRTLGPGAAGQTMYPCAPCPQCRGPCRAHGPTGRDPLALQCSHVHRQHSRRVGNARCSARWPAPASIAESPTGGDESEDDDGASATALSSIAPMSELGTLAGVSRPPDRPTPPRALPEPLPATLRLQQHMVAAFFDARAARAGGLTPGWGVRVFPDPWGPSRDGEHLDPCPPMGGLRISARQNSAASLPLHDNGTPLETSAVGSGS